MAVRAWGGGSPPRRLTGATALPVRHIVFGG